jgi:hypothetical protein
MVKAIEGLSSIGDSFAFQLQLPSSLFKRGILMFGGSTDLEFNGTYFLRRSFRITTGTIWFRASFYKPGKRFLK